MGLVELMVQVLDSNWTLFLMEFCVLEFSFRIVRSIKVLIYCEFSCRVFLNVILYKELNNFFEIFVFCVYQIVINNFFLFYIDIYFI